MLLPLEPTIPRPKRYFQLSVPASVKREPLVFSIFTLFYLYKTGPALDDRQCVAVTTTESAPGPKGTNGC